MKAEINIENSWKSLLNEEFGKKYFNEISQFFGLPLTINYLLFMLF